MLIATNPFNVFKFGLTGVFLILDGIVYWVVSKLFALYEVLAGARIFSQTTYKDIVTRINIIIGIVMLFYIAYSLLKYIINPDEANKGITKIAINIVISLALLGSVPYIFSKAYELQDIIIEDNVIGSIILGTKPPKRGEKTDDLKLSNNGNNMSFTVLNAFLNPDNIPIENDEHVKWGSFAAKLISGTESYMNITSFVEPVHDKTDGVTYIPLISSLCGLFLAYVILSFCFDLGVRVVKLAFYQLISPLPILMRIIPEKKSVFDNWVKASLATYLEVFIRIIIMYLVVFFASRLSDWEVSSGNVEIDLIAKVFIILGLFAFARQAPKLLSDVTGIDSGNIKLGIGGKLAAGGAFTMGAALGGLATAGVGNFVHGWKNMSNNWKEFNNMNPNSTLGERARTLGRALWSTTGSLFGTTFAGSVSGAARSGYGARNAQNAGDMRRSASQGAQAATGRRDAREAYRVAHGNTLRGVVGGHIEDAILSAAEWAQGGFEADEQRLKHYNDELSDRDASKAEAEKLKEKNSNNSAYMREVGRLMTTAGSGLSWKGNNAQRAEYQRIFNSMRDARGNQMSLEAMRSYVNSLENSDTTGMNPAQLRAHTINVANHKNMLNQLEKASWQALENAAYNDALAMAIGITKQVNGRTVVDHDKLSGIRKNVDNLNNRRRTAGESILNPANYKEYDDTLTQVENDRNRETAEYERRKREIEARQRNNGNGGS